MEAIYTEIIDKYLNGELVGEELKAFENKLKTDRQLQKELKLERELNQIILDEDTLDFRKEVIGIRKEMQQQHESNKSQQTVSITSRKWYLLAASIVVLVSLLGYLYFIQNQQISNEKLFAQYYSKYPADISERSGDDLSDDPYILGLTEYSQNNFMDALPYLIIAIDKDSLNFPAHLYLGIIYLETNALPDAIKTFKTITTNPGNMFTNQAKWYLALTYIKTDNADYSEETKNLLISIVQNKGDRAKEAEELLDKLE
jgi:cytochrome c-type biogenesis protein CcmH/NrfG